VIFGYFASDEQPPSTTHRKGKIQPNKEEKFKLQRQRKSVIWLAWIEPSRTQPLDYIGHKAISSLSSVTIKMKSHKIDFLENHGHNLVFYRISPDTMPV